MEKESSWRERIHKIASMSEGDRLQKAALDLVCTASVLEKEGLVITNLLHFDALLVALEERGGQL